MGLAKSPIERSLWTIPLTMAVAAIAIGLGGDELRVAMRFDRVWITEGEFWRLMTGHFAHLGWAHLGLNLAGLLLVWFLVGKRFDAVGWSIVIATAVLVMNVGLWIGNPQLIWYVGLSGLLHGLLAAGIVVKLNAADGETLVLAALLIGKLAWEQFAGPVPGSEVTTGGPVVVDAHLYGTVGGVVGALLLRIRAH